MRFFEMNNRLLVILIVDVLELLTGLVADETFFMNSLKMAPELVNIVKSLSTECACRMVKDQISVLGKLSCCDMPLILSLRIQNLF
jgi:hypothetical protein